MNMPATTWIWSLFAFISLAWLTPASFAADVRLEGDAAAAGAVWSVFQRWLQAYDRADLEQTMEIFDPGVVFIYQGSRNQSYSDLRKGYEQDFRTRAAGTAWVPLVDEVYADGNLGFVRATWELRVPAPGGAPPQVKERNRSVDILRLSNGRWRIIRSFNFPDK
jgi:uncharacterized protein (TIGR02246 family)